MPNITINNYNINNTRYRKQYSSKTPQAILKNKLSKTERVGRITDSTSKNSSAIFYYPQNDNNSLSSKDIYSNFKIKNQNDNVARRNS